MILQTIQRVIGIRHILVVSGIPLLVTTGLKLIDISPLPWLVASILLLFGFAFITKVAYEQKPITRLFFLYSAIKSFGGIFLSMVFGNALILYGSLIHILLAYAMFVRKRTEQ